PLLVSEIVFAGVPDWLPKPDTHTYTVAARTTVIATIRMTAMTGETASSSLFRNFRFAFISRSSESDFPTRMAAWLLGLFRVCPASHIAPPGPRPKPQERDPTEASRERLRSVQDPALPDAGRARLVPS